VEVRSGVAHLLPEARVNEVASFFALAVDRKGVSPVGPGGSWDSGRTRTERKMFQSKAGDAFPAVSLDARLVGQRKATGDDRADAFQLENQEVAMGRQLDLRIAQRVISFFPGGNEKLYHLVTPKSIRRAGRPWRGRVIVKRSADLHDPASFFEGDSHLNDLSFRDR